MALGPDLWNAAYVIMLRMEIPEENVSCLIYDNMTGLWQPTRSTLLKPKKNKCKTSKWIAEYVMSLVLNKIHLFNKTSYKKYFYTILLLYFETGNSKYYFGIVDTNI